MGYKSNIIVGLDIGTTKTACIIGECSENGVDIIGVGSASSTGIRKGEVINPEATCVSIREAVADAQLMAGCKVHSVIVGLGGEHIIGRNSDGMVALRNREVTEESILSVIEAASAIPELKDREIIHVIPQQYIVDHKTRTRRPSGVTGVRLDAEVHVVSAGRDSYDNIRKCVAECGLLVEKVVVDQVASGYAVVSEEEKELGVAVVDIGGGTTDIAIYANGALVHTEVIAVGGGHFTNDLSHALRCPLDVAEYMKIRNSSSFLVPSAQHREQIIDIPTVGYRPPRPISLDYLSAIIRLRAEELFEIIAKSIHEAGYADEIKAGIVITGGTSQITHLPSLAESVTRHRVRRGTPRGKIGGLVDVVEDPKYATGVGLVLYGTSNEDYASRQIQKKDSSFGRFVNVIYDYFSRAF